MRRLALYWLAAALFVCSPLLFGRGRSWANAHPEQRDGQKGWY